MPYNLLALIKHSKDTTLSLNYKLKCIIPFLRVIVLIRSGREFYIKLFSDITDMHVK